MTRSAGIGVVLLALVAVNAARDWRSRNARYREHVVHFLRGLNGVLELALADASRGGAPDPAVARALLERARARSRDVLFAAYVVDGRLVAATDGAPSGLEVVPETGVREDDHTAIFWDTPGVPHALENPRGPLPPSPEELAGHPLEPAHAHLPGRFVFGVPARLEGELAREEALDLSARTGALAFGIVGLAGIDELGRRNQQKTAALAAERARAKVLADLGLTAAGLAHETRNPLGIISGLAQQIAGDTGLSESLRVRAHQIIDEADRAASRLSEFIHFANVRDPVLEALDLGALVRGTLELLEPDARAARVRILTDVALARVRADRDMLGRLVLNLALNAIQASGAGKEIRVATGVELGKAWLEVSDEGRGIEPELRARLFTPYVTGRAEGHGLGLAVVKRVVELHRWMVELTSEVGRGTRVRVSGLEVVAEKEAGA